MSVLHRAPGLPSLDHLVALSDDVGVIQHAVYDVPNRSTGYCTDDVSRAFIVALSAMRHKPLQREASRLASIYLSFLHDAQRDDGHFHNFMAYDRAWLDEVGTEDSFGRAVWSLGFGMRFAARDSWRQICTAMLERSLPRAGELHYLRSKAYALLGLTHGYEAHARTEPALRAAIGKLAGDFKASFESVSAPAWVWFEDRMTYDNARLCEAVLRAGRALEDATLVDIGLRTLAFYESVVVENGVFVAIGNDGWYERGGKRARYDQQPLEAAALIDAGLAAFALGGDARHRELAEIGMKWFLGGNSERIPMAAGGGCRDGLHPGFANANMGAESTCAYLAGALAFAERPAPPIPSLRPER